MADFGLIPALSDVLKSNQDIKRLSFNESIYQKLPRRPKYPVISLELYNTWTDKHTHINEAIGRVNFCIKILFQSSFSKKCMELSHVIKDIIDGHSLRLTSTYFANFRKTGNVIDLPIVRRPRTIQLFFQAVIWECDTGGIQFEY